MILGKNIPLLFVNIFEFTALILYVFYLIYYKDYIRVRTQ